MFLFGHVDGLWINRILFNLLYFLAHGAYSHMLLGLINLVARWVVVGRLTPTNTFI